MALFFGLQRISILAKMIEILDKADILFNKTYWPKFENSEKLFFFEKTFPFSKLLQKHLFRKKTLKNEKFSTRYFDIYGKVRIDSEFDKVNIKLIQRRKQNKKQFIFLINNKRMFI